MKITELEAALKKELGYRAWFGTASEVGRRWNENGGKKRGPSTAKG